jgi:hypothetical protein
MSPKQEPNAIHHGDVVIFGADSLLLIALLPTDQKVLILVIQAPSCDQTSTARNYLIVMVHAPLIL